MKKRSLVIIGAMLISLIACQKENITEEVATTEAILEQDNKAVLGKASGEFCKFTLQANFKNDIDPITGQESCEFSRGDICVRVDCLPNPFIEINLPPVLWDPCQLVPCGFDFMDPWVIYERIDPREFRSFKEAYELRLDEKVEGVPFALNQNLLGVQFYSQPQSSYEIAYGDPTPQPSVFYLEKKIVLDGAVAKKLGLRGNVIEPGKYPVIFNKENKTHNVLLIIETGF
ncbi:hypothetical protein [uncultured Aquimarina sp.]|uniref:hypothetical protein n=1 Tax=uncultured Aquimarina sp. TaxID=575652 RepID=UPI00261701DF|nr:hypothetical protein [uncultured Aquimarina sp.]